MKKEIIIAAVVLILLATPVFASASSRANVNANNHGNSNGDNKDNAKSFQGHENQKSPKDNQTEQNNESVTVTPLPSTNQKEESSVESISLPTVSPVSGDDSSLQESGQSVKDCDPDANWKNHGEYVSCVAKTHPGGKTVSEAARSDIGKKHFEEEVTPTATPTPTLSITPTETPPVTSSLLKADEGFAPFKNLGLLFRRFFDFLKHSL